MDDAFKTAIQNAFINIGNTEEGKGAIWDMSLHKSAITIMSAQHRSDSGIECRNKR